MHNSSYVKRYYPVVFKLVDCAIKTKDYPTLILNKNLLVVFTNNFHIYFENLQNGANWMGSMDTE